MKGKKIAGISVYIWLGVVAGGLLLGIYLRRKGSSGSGNIAANSSYPISDPGAGTSGDPFTGLSGSSVGGSTAPDTSAIDPSTMGDLLNGLATETAAEQALTEQVAGLTDAFGSLVFQVGSSAGSGSSHKGKKSQPKHKAQQHPKKKKPVPHKVPRHHHPAPKKKAVHR